MNISHKFKGRGLDIMKKLWILLLIIVVTGIITIGSIIADAYFPSEAIVQKAEVSYNIKERAITETPKETAPLDDLKSSGFNEEKVSQQYASLEQFQIKKNTLNFTNQKEPLNERIIPNLNSILYNAVTNMVDRKRYVSAEYRPEEGMALLSFAPSRTAKQYTDTTAFVFSFLEKETHDLRASYLNEYKNMSERVSITLTINRLWFENIEEFNEDRREPDFEQALQSAIISIFPDEASQVYQYIISEYENEQTTYEPNQVIEMGLIQPIINTTIIGNYQVDMVWDGHLNFYFTRI